MTRAVDRKITVWMAGYYDDFMGARTVPDDLNVPTDTPLTGGLISIPDTLMLWWSERN